MTSAGDFNQFTTQRLVLIKAFAIMVIPALIALGFKVYFQADMSNYVLGITAIFAALPGVMLARLQCPRCNELFGKFHKRYYPERKQERKNRASYFRSSCINCGLKVDGSNLNDPYTLEYHPMEFSDHFDQLISNTIKLGFSCLGAGISMLVVTAYQKGQIPELTFPGAGPTYIAIAVIIHLLAVWLIVQQIHRFVLKPIAVKRNQTNNNN